jgi:hypothetical protein
MIGFLWVALWLTATQRKRIAHSAVSTGREYSSTYRWIFAFLAVLP